MPTEFHFDLSYWNIIITMVLPALVALITKRFAPGHVKALALVFLSIVGGLLNQVIAQGGSFEVGKTLWYIVLTFGGAVLVHFGLLAPAGVTGATGSIAKNIPGGVGPAGTEVAPPVVQAAVITDDGVVPEASDGLGR